MNSVHHIFTMIESECSCEHKWKQKGFQVVSIDSTQSSCRNHSRLECWLENLLLYWEELPTAWIFITGIFLTKNFQKHQMYTCFLFQIKVLLTDIIPYRKQTHKSDMSFNSSLRSLLVLQTRNDQAGTNIFLYGPVFKKVKEHSLKQ